MDKPLTMQLVFLYKFVVQQDCFREMHKSFIYNIHKGFFRGCKYCLLFAAAFSSSPVSAQIPLPDTAIVALVNGEPITIREFMPCAQNGRSLIIRFYRIKYGCGYDQDFWNKSFEGISPTDALKRKTLDTLTQIKIQQIIAKKWGIMPDISYSGFLGKLQTENLRRMEAIKRNKVVYGPVQYTENVYFSYLFTNMVNKLKSILDENIFKISDEKLREIYETEKDNSFGKGYFSEIRLVGIKLSPGAGTKSEKISKSAVIAIKNCIYNEDSCKVVATEFCKNNPEFALISEEINFNDSVYSSEEDDPIRSMVKETAKTMKKGGISPVLTYQKTNFVFYIKEKRALGYRSFADCKSFIKDSYVNKLYIQYVHNQCLDAKIDIDEGIFGKINF